MVNKVGSEKYYIIISLILGLIVLGLSLYFIFNEYFNEDRLNWQQCRQSIILRSNLPNLKGLGTDLKGSFPLKCKTEVVTIDSAEQEKVYGKISEAIAEGWYMFGEGKFDFIHSEFLEKDNYCLAFARIHYTSEAIEDFEKFKLEKNEDGSNKFSVVKYELDFYDYYRRTKIPGTSYTYEEYLPLVIFLKEGLNNALIPLSSSIYPQEKDLILVYATSKEKIGLVGRISKEWIDVEGWKDYIAGWISGDEEKIEGAKQGLIEHFNISRAIILVSPEDLDSLGCKFLSIPA